MKNLDTICVQGGYTPKSGEPRVTPIVQSTTYYYEKAGEMADLFDLKADGYFYTRLANPTVDVFEKKLTALDGGVMGIATASGMSATLLAVLNVCNAGDNVVASRAIYGGSYNLFSVTLPKYGIECRFFDPDDTKENIERLVDDKTKIIFAETIANPTIVVLDFEKLADIAKRNKVLFMVDNTLVTPVLCRPLDFGANVVIYSSSKYLDGHAVALGGVIIDGGNFDFKATDRYKEFLVPDESYHGLIYADLGKTAFGVKCRVQMMRDLGAIMSPQNAFLTNLGMETLALRMERHSENARKVAQFLSTHPKVEWILHPSLESNKYHDIAMKYMPKGQGGMMSFGVKGGKDKASEFMEKLEMIAIVTHVADARSCVLHPASTTHRQLSTSDLEAIGIKENLIRLSVGIENPEDIINDIKQALDAI
ncbi:MAG: O-acetylhomoserine aminocarboxypropyltransferase/cysteine synthase [Clostridia bacterium]|nr:O-acetylhomoserine aminocarboxypropyltransferase/cysteine synthase [Clostridia bacterium]MBR2444595.1 O-acetylhomoserine aminocarboxypropyltransferase/cysteine synthase [Clostridia bacterium]